jgi:ABC-type spermidine/putrescine transport system permease subunit II
MLARSLMVDGGFSLENYRHLLATERSWRLLGNSLGLALATAQAGAACLLGER